MRRLPSLLMLLLGLAPLLAGSSAMAAEKNGERAPDLVAYTEEWAPYNFSEGGEIKGISSDLLRAMCAEARLQCELNIVPWARAYTVALNTPNTLVYTTARKPFREKLFGWVGPILPRATWVYGRANAERTLRGPKDMPLHRFGVVRGDASVQDLLDAGVPQASLMTDSSNAAALRMLYSGWVDAYIDTEIGLAWTLKMTGIPAGAIVPLFPFNEGGHYYFALNAKSDPELAVKLQRALDALRKNGRFDAIVRSYKINPAVE